MRSKLLLISGITCLVPWVTNSSVFAQSIFTWQALQSDVQQGKADSLQRLVPTQIPADFSRGQIAISALHTGRTAYVVAKVGKKLPNLSTVRQQIGQNINFNAANGYPELAAMPAVNSFPNQLYNASSLVEVSRYAARYDSEDTRYRARQSQTAVLPNGQTAYYLKQDNGRQGWCTFEDEPARFSAFVCVNIAGSANSALKILESVVVK
jgi:hypothetical protein